MSDFKIVSVLNPTVVLTGGPVISAGASSQATGTIVFSNSNNVSFGLSNGTMTASMAGGGGGIAAAAGTQTATSGTVNFANSNGVTFGMSGSNQITASHNGLVQSVADTLYYPKVFPGEPNGFVDRTQTTVSWDNVTRTLTISPTGVNYVVWSDGVKLTISTTKTFTISNTEGAHFVYFDASGNLQEFTGSFDVALILTWAYVAYVYWDATNLLAVPDVQNEQHGADWPPELHLQQHLTVGTRYQDGLALTVSANGSGATLADIEVAGALGHIWDEDIQHAVSARVITDNIPLLYRTGASGLWRFDETSPALVRTAGTGRAAFNENTGSTWQLTEITDTWFGVAYVYATPGLTKKWIAVMGQNQYATLELAETAAQTAPAAGQMPFLEFKLIGSIVFNTDNTYGNAVKSRIVSTLPGGFYDWRYTSQATPSAPPTTDTYNVLAAGTQTAGTATTVNFANSNGITFGMSGSNQITASHNGLTAATVFSNSNNVSFGLAGSTVTATATFSQSNQTVGFYAGGNTTGQSSSSTFDARSVSFSGAGIASVGYSAGSVVISVPAGGGGGDGINALVVNGGVSTVSTTLALSNANNVSFGLNAGTITASASYSQSTQPVAIQGSNGSFAFSTVTFGSSNGLHFYSTNGSIVGSYTVPVQTNQSAIRGFGVSNTGQTAGNTGISTGIDWVLAGSNSITLSQSTAIGGPNTIWFQHPAWLTTAAQSNQVVNSVNGSAGQINFAVGSSLSSSLNGSSITWGLASNITTALQSAGAYLTTAALSNHSHGFSASGGSSVFQTLNFSNANNVTFSNSNGQVVASASFVAQTNQTVGLYHVGNTTGQSSSSTVDARSLSFSGAGIASVGMSAGQVIISVPSGGGAGDGVNIVSMLTSTSGGGTLGATFSSISGSVGFMAGSNITLSQTSNTIVINGAAGGGGAAATVGGWEVFPAGNNSVFSTLGLNTIQFQKLRPQANVSFNNFELRGSGSTVSSSNSQVASHTYDYALYARNVGASSTQVSLVASSRIVYGASYNSNTAAGYTVSQGAASFTSSSAGTVLMSALSGFKHLYLPFTTTLTAGGEYWFGLRMSSATTVGTSPLRFGVLEQSVINNLTIGKIYASTVLATNTSYVGDYNQAIYTVTSGAFPAAVADNQVSNAVSQMRLYMQLEV